MSLLHEWTTYAAHINREDGEITLDQLTGEEFTKEELARLYIEAEGFVTAANKVKGAIAQALMGVVDKPVTVDGWLVWKGENHKEVCIDTDGFADWLGKNPDIVAKLFNPNEVRFGALPPAVRDTFYEKQTYGKVEVKAASLEVLADAKRKKRR